MSSGPHSTYFPWPSAAWATFGVIVRASFTTSPSFQSRSKVTKVPSLLSPWGSASSPLTVREWLLHQPGMRKTKGKRFPSGMEKRKVMSPLKG